MFVLHDELTLTDHPPQFQQETMASLMRYYKQRNIKLMDRLRVDSAEKKALKQYEKGIPSHSILFI